MRAIDRLRALEEFEEARAGEPTKPPEGASVSSVGAKPASFQKIAHANAYRSATVGQAAELRQLVSIVAEDWPADEQAEALALALADPTDALTCFRTLAEAIAEAPPAGPKPDPRMRTCRQCLHLSPGGRCLAAWRGESFGDGIAVRRDFAPPEPDRPQRCARYSPGPDDPDRRVGSERWPWLFAPGGTSG